MLSNSSRRSSLISVACRLVATSILILGISTALEQEAPYKGIAPYGKEYVYKDLGDRKLHLYIAMPDPSIYPGLRPAFVAFHGGGFMIGGPQMFNPQSLYLVKRGLVTVEVEYRFANEHAAPEKPAIEDCIRDARSAMRWVRGHSASLGIDPDRILGAGGSAGGYLIAADAYLDGPNEPGEDISISTIPNALVLYNPALNGEPGSPIYKYLGDQYIALSPYLHIPIHSPPVLMMSGLADTTIGVDDVRDFQRRLKRSGAHAELMLYPNQGHGFFNRGPYVAATNAAVDNFLQSLGWVDDKRPNPETALPTPMQPQIVDPVIPEKVVPFPTPKITR